MGRWFVIDKLANDEMQIDKSPYAYSWNSPININDPDGDCPMCIGALVGALVDVVVQVVEISLDDTKTSEDFSWTSVAVSALAGASGMGLASKLKKVNTITRLTINLATDMTASSATQLAKDGKVDVTDVLIDAVAGQTAGKIAGDALNSKFLKSSKGRRLIEKVNQQINASKGKSNIISKAKANIRGQKKN